MPFQLTYWPNRWVSKIADDDHVLACAIEATADLIVTGDADLLILGGYERTSIVTAAEALRRIETQK